MKYFFTALIFIASFSQAYADGTILIKAEDSSFEVSIPKAWQLSDKKSLQAPVILSAIEKNKEASLIIQFTTESKMSCKDFLASMDSSRGAKNTLTVEKQKISAEDLKKAASDEIALGEYEIQGKGPGFPVMQKSACYKAKDQIRVLTASWQKKKAASYENALKNIFASFKFLPLPAKK